MKEQKFNKVYSKYAKDIYRFCMFKLSNKQEAEDLTSEVFIDLYKQDLNKEFHIRGWLYKVARNKIYDHYNKAMKSNDSENQQVSQLIDAELISNLKSTESIALDKAMVEKIESELKNLDSVTSEIIVLRLWDEMSFNEIAEIVNENINKIKARFYRGIEQIKANLSMEVKQEKSYKLNSFAFIFAGIIGITSQPAYAFSAVSTSLSAGVGGILGINLGNMAIAETTGIAAFLSTAAGKLAVTGVATATITTGAIGGYAIVQNNNEEVINEPEIIQESQPEVVTNQEIFEESVPESPTNQPNENIEEEDTSNNNENEIEEETEITQDQVLSFNFSLPIDLVTCENYFITRGYNQGFYEALQYATNSIECNILVAESGVVENIELETIAGTMITIRHDNNHVSYYGIGDDGVVEVAVGQNVSKGQIIATNGKVPGVSGEGENGYLRFSIRINGEFVDPSQQIQ